MFAAGPPNIAGDDAAAKPPSHNSQPSQQAQPASQLASQPAEQ